MLSSRLRDSGLLASPTDLLSLDCVVLQRRKERNLFGSTTMPSFIRVAISQSRCLVNLGELELEVEVVAMVAAVTEVGLLLDDPLGAIGPLLGATAIAPRSTAVAAEAATGVSRPTITTAAAQSAGMTVVGAPSVTTTVLGSSSRMEEVAAPAIAVAPLLLLPTTATGLVGPGRLKAATIVSPSAATQLPAGAIVRGDRSPSRRREPASAVVSWDTGRRIAPTSWDRGTR